MNVPITQSKEWQTLQNDLKETSFYREETDYLYLAILKHTPVGNYLYLPYGPVTKTPQGIKPALKSLNQLAREQHCLFIRIEPQDTKTIKYFPKNTKKSQDLNPKETWVMDLNGTDEEFKQKLPSRLLRYYKNHEKNGLQITTSHNPEDIKYLLNLQKALASKKGISTFSEEYLKTELSQPFATLYLVKQCEDTDLHRRVTAPEGAPHGALRHGGGQDLAGPVERIIAAGLVFDDQTTRYNLQGAQTDEGRKLHATGILTIQLIKDAKEKQLKSFDFWGIAPDGAPDNHPWKGFTAFKKTFAGREVVYAGTHDIILRPVKYKLYQLLRWANRLIH